MFAEEDVRVAEFRSSERKAFPQCPRPASEMQFWRRSAGADGEVSNLRPVGNQNDVAGADLDRFRFPDFDVG